MRNLLYQLKRIGQHTKNIIMKIMSKMLSSTKTSAKAILNSIAILVVIPAIMFFWGIVAVILIMFDALGGVPEKVPNV